VCSSDLVIVCGLDGSTSDVELVRASADLAEVMDAELHLLHVLGANVTPDAGGPSAHAPGRWTGKHGAAGEASERLARLSENVGAASVHSHVAPYGDPGRRLAALAERVRASLIVVGSRGKRGKPDALLGSVSSRLAADAPCPVLVIPPGVARHVDPTAWRQRTIVCGLDGSRTGWNAARETALLASTLDSSVALVSVGPGPTDSIAVMSRLRHDVMSRSEPAANRMPCPLRHETRAGDPAWELEGVAAASTAPFIAVGSRGKGPWQEAVLGSVTRRLLLTARRPILVLPATAFPDPLA